MASSSYSETDRAEQALTANAPMSLSDFRAHTDMAWTPGNFHLWLLVRSENNCVHFLPRWLTRRAKEPVHRHTDDAGGAVTYQPGTPDECFGTILGVDSAPEDMIRDNMRQKGHFGSIDGATMRQNWRGATRWNLSGQSRAMTLVLCAKPSGKVCTPMRKTSPDTRCVVRRERLAATDSLWSIPTVECS